MATLNCSPGVRRCHSYRHVHVHERRHVKVLGVTKPQLRRLADAVALPEHVPMPLAPRRVGDFGDHGVHRLPGAVEAVVQAQRTEVVAPVAQQREQADRARSAANRSALRPDPGRRRPRALADRPDGPCGGTRRARKQRGCRPITAVQQRRQFVEVQVHQVQPVAEHMFRGAQPPVLDIPLVQATVHDSNRLPKHWPTAKALLTPSS